MKKFFTLIAGVMLAATASATTPYKNIHAAVSVYPAGAGLVYLTAKDEEEQGLTYEQSEDFAETAFIKVTSGENGDPTQCNPATYNEEGVKTGGNEGFMEDALGTLGYYDVNLAIMPEDGYEFVALTTEVAEDGVYTPATAIMRRVGGATNEFVFHWDYEMSGDDYFYNLININSADVPVVMNSDQGAKSDAYAKGGWSEEPDTHYYAVFRKVGAEYPKLVLDQAAGVEKVVMSAEAEAALFNVAGQKVSADAKGIVIMNGKKVMVK